MSNFDASTMPRPLLSLGAEEPNTRKGLAFLRSEASISSTTQTRTGEQGAGIVGKGFSLPPEGHWAALHPAQSHHTHLD